MAYASSIASAIVQIFNYMQNMGATVNLPKFNIPEEVSNVITIFTRFLHAILNFIPGLPPIDVRAQLAILSLGVPLFLDIIFVWFVNPFFQVLSHLLDLVILFLFSMSVTQGIIISWSFGKYLCIGLSLVYLILRITVLCIKNQKITHTNLNTCVKDICKVWMTCVIPGVKTEKSFKTVRKEIQNFSKLAQYKAKTPSSFSIVVKVLFCLALLILGILSLNPERFNFIGIISQFLPYIFFIFLFLMVLYLLLSFFECGRNFIIKLKHFANHWGLRLLMLFLDLLYIPILTNMVTLVTPEEFTCGEGFYLQYQKVPLPTDSVIDKSLFLFVNHTYECRQCYPALASYRPECITACSGAKEWRILGVLNLRIVEDVLAVCGGILLFTIFAFLIGIPVLWRVIIRRNRSAVKRINIYGNSFDRKWKAIVHRLNSTGIFLFSIYNLNASNWSILLFIIKLLVMAITTVSGRINTNAYWALPILYIMCFISTIVIKPFIYRSNQILNIILYLFNFIYSLLPLISYFGYEIPSKVTLIISLVLVVIPIISMVSMLFCKHDVFMKKDPTYMDKKKLMKQKRKYRKNKRNHITEKESIPKRSTYKTKSSKKRNGQDQDKLLHNTDDSSNSSLFDSSSFSFSSYSSFELSADDNEFNIIDDDLENLNDNEAEEYKNRLQKDASHPPFQTNKEITIHEGYMDSINSRYYALKQYAKNCSTLRDPEIQAENILHPTFTISKRLIYNRAVKMYKMIDIILDGSTIEILTKTLNSVMLFGAIAFGWYVGALLASLEKETNIFCG